MEFISIQRKSTPQRIWAVGASFVLFQFFLQLSSGVVIGAIMHDMHLSALAAGVLSSAFYIIYTALQIPVGILFDRCNPRVLLTSSALLCAVGCWIFATNYTLTGLFFGRTLIGAGSAFAFVGLTHLIRRQFPARQFAFMIGVSETMGFIATVLGIIGMGSMILIWGWRDFILGAAIVGALIALTCWLYIPDEKKSTAPMPNYSQQLLLIFKNRKLWINGLFIGLTFAVVTVFGALWAASFIQIKLGCSLRQASLINALFFLGTGLSCPLFGGLSSYLNRRKPLILSACIVTTILLFFILYFPTNSLVMMSCLLFMTGLFSGSYIIAFPIANELSPANAYSTCTGFINMLALVTTPILQPLIGYLLDASSTTRIYSVMDYQRALLVIPGSLLIACVLVCFLPEKPRYRR